MDVQISTELIDFIAEHAGQTPASLMLRYGGKTDMPLAFVAEQLECRKRFAAKLPRFIAERGFLFPTRVAGEQSSNQQIAEYHASLIGQNARRIADFTAGLGVDIMSIASTHPEANIVAFEMDEWKAKVLKHNVETMSINNVDVIPADSIAWLEEQRQNNDFQAFDYIFIDPHRRDEKGGRVYGLSDCLPDVVLYRNLLLDSTRRLIIKASPMLDISQTLREIPEATSIRVVCSRGECKEILIEAEANGTLQFMEGIDIKADGSQSVFRIECGEVSDTVEVDDTTKNQRVDDEDRYLFIPNAALMKLAPWQQLKKVFPELRKVSTNTHIWIGARIPEESFPGEIYRIDETLESGKLKKLKGERYNVISRNYPETADKITSRLKLKSSDSRYIIAMRLADAKTVMYATERLQ